MHILLFEFHGGMYVSVQGVFTVACPRISLRLLTSKPSSIQRVANVCLNAWKFTGIQTTLFLYIMEIFLHGAGLDVFFIYSGKDISLSVGKFLLNELDQTVWNWNCTDRTFAFG